MNGADGQTDSGSYVLRCLAIRNSWEPRLSSSFLFMDQSSLYKTRERWAARPLTLAAQLLQRVSVEMRSVLRRYFYIEAALERAGYIGSDPKSRSCSIFWLLAPTIDLGPVACCYFLLFFFLSHPAVLSLSLSITLHRDRMPLPSFVLYE